MKQSWSSPLCLFSYFLGGIFTESAHRCTPLLPPVTPACEDNRLAPVHSIFYFLVVVVASLYDCVCASFVGLSDGPVLSLALVG